MTKFWDGTESMDWVFDDGGRASAGYKGSAGDCVCRSIAIVTGHPYKELYAELAHGMGSQRKSRGASARNGITTGRKWFKDYMRSLGFIWTPTMLVGQGCKVHLVNGELPMGRLVVSLSRHYTAVIDGVIRDTYNPQRQTIIVDDAGKRMAHRCVYGYWQLV